MPAGATYLAAAGGCNASGAGLCTRRQTATVGASNATQYCDNVAYVGGRMGAHVAPAGWAITPVPNVVPTAKEGWRESGSLDATGAPLSVAAREKTYASSTADLSGLNTRAKVFAQWNNGAGWIPAP